MFAWQPPRCQRRGGSEGPGQAALKARMSTRPPTPSIRLWKGPPPPGFAIPYCKTQPLSRGAPCRKSDRLSPPPCRLAGADGFLGPQKPGGTEAAPSCAPAHSQRGLRLARMVAGVRKARSAGQRRPLGPLQDRAAVLPREVWSPPAPRPSHSRNLGGVTVALECGGCGARGPPLPVRAASTCANR